MGGGIPIGIGGFLVLLVLSWATGTDFLSLLGGGSGAPASDVSDTAGRVETTPEEERMVDFVDAVAGDTQDAWQQLLGDRYERTRVVLFRDAIQSGCGGAESATGPFYCPADHKVYLDLSFFNELSRRFGAPGDFAQAYVVAHEFGHHVQNLLGTMRQFDAQSQRVDERTRNALSVRLELQADCYAGVWGFFAQKRNKIDANDIESGLRAAAAVGDDNISHGRLPADSFTHGSAEQRARWFRTGLQSGDPRDCNTFEAR
jgi:predicted metalloprotease